MTGEKLPKGTLFVATVTDVRFADNDTVVLTSEGGWLYPGESDQISQSNQNNSKCGIALD